MEALIWAGAFVSLCGVAGLIYCVMSAFKLRGANADDEATKRGLRKVVIINMAALAISALGLIMVVMGIFLAK